MRKRVSPNSAREADDHPLDRRPGPHSPNADMDRMQFREAKAANLALRGNTYSLKETRADGSRRLALSDAVEVLHARARPSDQCDAPCNTRTAIAAARSSTRCREDLAREPLRLRRHDRPARRSAIRRNAVALTAAAEEFGSRFFGQGARASALIKIPQWLEDDQRVKAKKNLQELGTAASTTRIKHQASSRAAWNTRRSSAKPGEAQHNELRGFQIPRYLPVLRRAAASRFRPRARQL
jgi:phage portal protein BeeE